MDRSKRPTFFWQGTLIMLPVIVLAIVSLALVHRDEQAAEQEARDRAAQSAQALARAVLNSALTELEAFAKVEASIDAETSRSEWQSKYPSLKIENLLLPPCVLSASGQIIKPAASDGIPEPPRWFLALSPQQLQLWHALSTAAPEKLQSAFEAFTGSGPSGEAVLAAQNLLWAAGIGPSNFDHPGVATESGVSFGDVYCFRCLTDRGPLNQSTLTRLQEQVIDRPSFLSPTLLELAEPAAEGSTLEIQNQLRALHRRWEMQATARNLLKPLVAARQLTNRTPQAVWVKDGLTQALAFLTKTEGNQTWNVSLVSKTVVEAAFARALAENRFMIPSYATPALALDGETLAPRVAVLSTASRLAQATQTSSAWPIRLDVELYLTDRAQLLSAERRYAGLLGSLVAGTVVTALLGLFVARRAFNQQLRLNEMKSNFVSAVSHELRAPIASMRLLAEGLDRGKITDSQKQKEYFRFIVQECRRLSSLIGNVLDFSRIDQGRKRYEFEPANLVALVEQTVALMTPSASEREVQVLFPHEKELSAQLNCDSLAVQQALINLIDNAIKHSPSGSTVTVGLDRMENGAAPGFCLWVEDQGPGIPREEHEKIFERFYRRGSELRRETQGIGIGLTIVKHIVEAHHGRVRVHSVVGQGSRFTIELISVTQTQNG